MSEGILVSDHDHGIQSIYIAVAIEVGYGEASIGDAVPSDDEVVVGGVDPAGSTWAPPGIKALWRSAQLPAQVAARKVPPGPGTKV